MVGEGVGTGALPLQNRGFSENETALLLKGDARGIETRLQARETEGFSLKLTPTALSVSPTLSLSHSHPLLLI